MRIYTHPEYLNHQVMDGHPERPERLSHLMKHLSQIGLTQDFEVVQPQPVPTSRILAAHSQSHVDFLRGTSPEEGIVPLDPDTWMSPASFSAAELAAGAVFSGMDTVLNGAQQRVFCAVRPPGHHAERDSAMGFCLLNSVAIAAIAALDHAEVERVAILDFDVHHGNGTVDVCRDHPQILVCSSFQSPYYPNRLDDLVQPNIVNTPLVAGSDGRVFRAALERDWLPALEAHQPDIVFVSAGFDAHVNDPLADLRLVEDDYRWVTQFIVSMAIQYAQGRVVSTLEGGYDLDALARSVTAHLGALA
ncbi:MAG: histone deacetylase family protein [Pseudomonadota bacterium]|jgi:acetoin utilization deacetylase AcuC-like enzyme|nr:histone deacetylase family protein [Pseudomonadota bacterium]MEC8143974.1 histone deacetylase family protein [Pseudomonadota bacterium]MEC8346789.1 histone deacetylase family protein [Pseudomonadota bacterium]MEC8436918.1 histone deacetylase family protein [Pseudomonadota bacterium]MEC8618835.1 histone deacetylase family protein [Pseudomonadota bacterium]